MTPFRIQHSMSAFNGLIIWRFNFIKSSCWLVISIWSSLIEPFRWGMISQSLRVVHWGTRILSAISICANYMQASYTWSGLGRAMADLLNLLTHTPAGRLPDKLDHHIWLCVNVEINLTDMRTYVDFFSLLIPFSSFLHNSFCCVCVRARAAKRCQSNYDARCLSVVFL